MKLGIKPGIRTSQLQIIIMLSRVRDGDGVTLQVPVGVYLGEAEGCPQLVWSPKGEGAKPYSGVFCAEAWRDSASFNLPSLYRTHSMFCSIIYGYRLVTLIPCLYRR